MPSPESPYERLLQLSRRAPETSTVDPLPAALATRVLAQVRAGAREPVSAWEWLSFRAVPVAAVVALVCVLLPDDAWTPPLADEQRLAEALVAQQLLP